MSITSLSFTFVNTYAAQSAKPAAAAERQAPAAQTDVKHCGEHRPASRPNRLVEAMMSALRELGLGSQAAAAPAAQAATDTPAAAADTQAAAVDTASTGNEAAAATAVSDSAAQTVTAVAGSEAAAEPPATVESAVRQFAYELFSALRQVGRGESSEQSSNRIEGDDGRRHHHGHHGRHGHHGWRREGYGDMAQRLDALSQTFAAPAAAAAAGDGASTPLVSSSISITLTVQDGQTDPPADAVTTTAPMVTAPVAEETAKAAAATAATAPRMVQETAKNPLLEAFSKLFNTIKPQAVGTPPMDMADKLRTFLQTLAQAMRPETMSSIQTPQVGGLVNVTA